MKAIRKVRFFTTVLLAGAVMFGFFTTFAGAAERKVVVYARPLVGGVDPATCGKSEGVQNLRLVYDTLVMINKHGKILPALAKSWKVSPDFKTYIFHLRKGVTFQDGTPLTAYAVKFSFDRMLRVHRAAYGNYLKYGKPDGCTVIDDHTIKIELKKPFAIFLVDLTAPAYDIVSPEYVKKHATAKDPDALKYMTDHACGTGPFKLVEYTHGQQMVYEKFKKYWGTKGSVKSPAKIDELIIKIVTDPSSARLMLDKGDAGVVEKLTMDQFEAERSDPNVRVVSYLVPQVVYLTMDVSKPPFDDINVRKAISYAINTEEIIKYIERGQAKRMHGLIPAGIMGHNPNLPIYAYDLGKAKEYLKKSKYPNGFKTNLIFSVARRPEFEQVAEYIQAYLKKIGIDVSVQKMTFDSQLAKMSKGAYGLSLMTWTTVLPDPEDIAGWLYDAKRSTGGWNGSYWFNKKALKMISETRQTADQSKRKKLYQAVDKMAVNQAIYVDLYQLTKQFALRKDIEDFSFDPLLKIHFWSINKR